MNKFSHHRDFLSMPKARIIQILFDSIEAYGGEYLDFDVTYPEAEEMIEEAKANGGCMDKILDVDFGVKVKGDEIDLSGYGARYGEDVLSRAVIDCQKEAIQAEPLLNDLCPLAKGCGLSSAYRIVTNAHDPANNGIYFVFGARYRGVYDEKLDIEKLLKSQKKNYSTRMDLHAVKLTGNSVYAIHNEIHYMMNDMEFVKAMVLKYNISSSEYYRYFSNNDISKMKMLYKNSLNRKELTYEQREANRCALAGVVCDAVARGNRHDFRTDTRGKEVLRSDTFSFFNDNQKGLKEMVRNTFGIDDFKTLKRFIDEYRFDETELSFEDFFNNVTEAACIKLNEADKEDRELEFYSMIADYGDIPYTRIKDKKGDIYYLYDARYKEEMAYFYMKSLYKKENGEITPDIYKSETGTVMNFGIHLNDIEILLKNAKEKFGTSSFIYFPNDVSFLKGTSQEDCDKQNYLYTVSCFLENKEDLLSCAEGIRLETAPSVCRTETPELFKIYGKKRVMDFVEKVAEKKNIPYFRSKTQTYKINTYGNKGYGWGKGDNTFNTAVMVFDKKDRQAIEQTLLMEKQPECFEMTYGELLDCVKKANGSLAKVAVTDKTLFQLGDNLKNFNIPFAINEDCFFSNDYLERPYAEKCYFVSFPAAYAKKVADTLDFLTIVDKGFNHLLSDYDEKEYEKALKSEATQKEELAEGRWDDEIR